jgi:hypothetical protein
MGTSSSKSAQSTNGGTENTIFRGFTAFGLVGILKRFVFVGWTFNLDTDQAFCVQVDLEEP